MEFDKLFSSMLDYEDFEEPYLPYSNRMLAKRSPGDYYKPMIDYYEDDKEFIATIELPGVNREDIEVSIGDDNQLEIKVEKRDEAKVEDKKKGFYKYQKNYSGFYRTVPLPDNIDRDSIKASYKNGVLELKIAKKLIAGSRKKIQIE